MAGWGDFFAYALGDRSLSHYILEYYLDFLIVSLSLSLSTVLRELVGDFSFLMLIFKSRLLLSARAPSAPMLLFCRLRGERRGERGHKQIPTHPPTH